MPPSATYASVLPSGDQSRSNQSHSGGRHARSCLSCPVARSTTWMPLYGFADPKDVTARASRRPVGDQSMLKTQPHHSTPFGHRTTGRRRPSPAIDDRPYHPSSPPPFAFGAASMIVNSPFFADLVLAD